MTQRHKMANVIGKMAQEDLEYYISLVDTAAPGFERVDSDLGRSSTLGKMLSNSIPGYREIIHDRRSQWIW